ncbi:MAG: pitrilysin family protein [Myxococcota bacterium]
MVSLTLLLAGVLGAHAASPEAEIPFEQYQLDNGLNVILSEDHSVPFVQVNLWYDVGSKDEEPGRTGFAHLFEHLMFQGSENLDSEYFDPLEKIGAQVNGTTSFDRTNYYEGVPSEYLPVALWLESDRMGYLLGALTEDKLANQKEVVRNERRQRYENTPYGESWTWLFENLYPEGHPYHVPTIGRHEDIDNATMDDVKAFFQKWYVPSNASLSIVGDFDPAEAKNLVEMYFGEIPGGDKPQSITEATATLSAEKIVRKTDAVPDSKVWIAWLSPKLMAENDGEMDVLADILADGKESRLYNRLVRETQIAKDVSAFQYSLLLNGQFIITATAAEGHTSDEVVAEIDAVLEEIRSEGVTGEEVDISKTNILAGAYDAMLTIAQKADILNAYYTQGGDPGLLDEDIARYQSVTLRSANAAFNEILVPDRRVILHVTPETPAGPQGGE